MGNFFESNSLIAAVTLIAGFVALFIYYKEKNDKKRDLAKLILQEVRYAENKIKEYRTHKNYKLHYRLLPTNSWNDNIHLFITDFEQSQTDLISSFYSQASYIDNVIQKISDDKLKQRSYPATQLSPVQNFQQYPQQPFQMVPPIQQIIFPADAQNILDETSLSVELIYNTPITSKLKTLAEKKWYQI